MNDQQPRAHIELECPGLCEVIVMQKHGITNILKSNFARRVGCGICSDSVSLSNMVHNALCWLTAHLFTCIDIDAKLVGCA